MDVENSVYESAVKGRSDFREALKVEREKVRALSEREQDLLSLLRSAKKHVDPVIQFRLVEQIDKALAQPGGGTAF